MQLFSIFQAFLARFLFFVHSFVAIWRCTDVLGDPKLWLLTLAHAALLVETVITCCKRKGREWKWFSPAILIFLMASVPPIWFLELDRLHKYKESVHRANLTTVEESLSDIQGITIPLKLSPSLWVTVIEQMLLLFLILGRWIMPKGEISRDALSQLLFVYIGMSSDIMELFVLFEEEQVLRDTNLSYTILAVWTVSLLQFCMVLTATKNPKKTRVAVDGEAESRKLKPTECCGKFCSTEAWSIFVSLFMQDGPFLIVRMYIMIKYYLITYNTIFFTCKNMLMVTLLVYRIFVVCSRRPDKEDPEKPDKETPNTIPVQPAEMKNKRNSVGIVRKTPSPEMMMPSGDKLGLVYHSQKSAGLGNQTPKFSVPL